MSAGPQINLNDLPPTLLVYGKEPYFRARFIQRLRDWLQTEVEIDDLWCHDKMKSAEVVSTLEQNSMWGSDLDRRAVFLWDFQSIKDRDKKLLPYLDDPAPKTMAVFVMSEGSRAAGALIKRLKAGPKFESATLDADKYDRYDNLWPWIQQHFREHGLTVSEALCKSLHQHVGMDLFTLESEMRRIVTYCGGRTEAHVEDFERVVVPRVHADVFELTDALIRLDLPRSMKVVHEIFTLTARSKKKDSKQMAIGVLAVLLQSFQRWFQIKAMQKSLSFEQIADEIKLSPYIVEKKIWPHVKKLNMRRLLRLQSLVCRADYLVKTSGQDGQVLVELLVLDACGVLTRRLDTYP